MVLPGARARVAQLVEHATENRSVGGSTPSPGTIYTFSIVQFLVRASEIRQSWGAFRSGPAVEVRAKSWLVGANWGLTQLLSPHLNDQSVAAFSTSS